jgi:hypothetical protein
VKFVQSGSGNKPVADFCEQNSEASGSVQRKNFLKDEQLLASQEGHCCTKAV